MTDSSKEENSFASEIISELKTQNKRQFVLVILLVVLEALTIAWFTLPTEENQEREEVTLTSAEDGNASYFKGDSNQIGGDFNNGYDYGQDDKSNKEAY